MAHDITFNHNTLSMTEFLSEYDNSKLAPFSDVAGKTAIEIWSEVSLALQNIRQDHGMVQTITENGLIETYPTEADAQAAVTECDAYIASLPKSVYATETRPWSDGTTREIDKQASAYEFITVEYAELTTS